MKKKMLWSIILGEIVLLLVGVGVIAIYVDTETTGSNTFTASTLNLQVGSADPCAETITTPGLTPGATGNAATWLVSNIGAISGDLSVAVSAITNNENGCSEVESNAGDATSGAAQGELGGVLTMAMWMDKDSSGTWNAGDFYLNNDGTTIAYASPGLPAAAYHTVNTYGGVSYTNIVTNAGAGDIGTFRVEYNLPGSADSTIQSDSSVFVLTFTFSQH
ncbi:MAG TPA: hypothetical protein VLT35_01205 [Methanocella sp.]|nr:hypothetical protein [Methanocella sp.]